MSYGYLRAEIIGALSSVLIIWGLTIFLVIEAIYRLLNPPKIEASNLDNKLYKIYKNKNKVMLFGYMIQ